jgi:hypothetical protein
VRIGQPVFVRVGVIGLVFSRSGGLQPAETTAVWKAPLLGVVAFEMSLVSQRVSTDVAPNVT